MGDFISAIMAVLCVFAALLIIRGFAPYAMAGGRGRTGNGVVATTYRLSSGVALVIASYSARTFYWDVMPDLMRWWNADAWADWFATSGMAANVVFGAVFLRGIYHLAVLLWLLIPDEDRGGWSVLTAAWYPRHNAWTRAVGAWRDKLVSRRRDHHGH